MRRYVIIGAGVAGIAAIEAIREHDNQGDITVITNDSDGYYSRPGLAYLLNHEIPENMLFPFNKEDFLKLNAHWIQGNVSCIEPENHTLRLTHKDRPGERSIYYDSLLIATGAYASPINTPGNNLEGVYKLDNLEDARRIIRQSRRTKSAVVVGGGITALELVEGLVTNGLKVHYLLRGDRYWNNVLDETESRIVEQRLRDEGVKIYFHTELDEILGRKGQVEAVQTKDGKLIKCGILAYAIGIQPRVDIARQAGLKIDRGVLVDETMRTSIPDVFAAGDVAQVFDPLTGKSVLDSLWKPARDQGYTAGANMAGQTKVYIKSVAFNVTRLAGLTTTIIGVVGQGKDLDVQGIARGDSETWRQLPDAISAQSDFEINRLRIILDKQHIIGAVVMGDQTLSQPLQRLITDQVDIQPIREQLLAGNSKLADILVDFYTQVYTRKA